MLKRVEVKDPGDSELLSGEVIDLIDINIINEKLRADKETSGIRESFTWNYQSISSNKFIHFGSFIPRNYQSINWRIHKR